PLLHVLPLEKIGHETNVVKAALVLGSISSRERHQETGRLNRDENASRQRRRAKAEAVSSVASRQQPQGHRTPEDRPETVQHLAQGKQPAVVAEKRLAKGDDEGELVNAPAKQTEDQAASHRLTQPPRGPGFRFEAPKVQGGQRQKRQRQD